MIIITTSDNDYQMARKRFDEEHDIWLVEAEPKDLPRALDLRGISKRAEIVLFGSSQNAREKAFEFIAASYPRTSTCPV